MGKVVRMKPKVRPLRATYDPTSPYVVEREDQDNGTITYKVQDTRPDSFRCVCSTSDYEGDNPYAKHDAEQVARALNLLVQYGKERLPKVKDRS